MAHTDEVKVSLTHSVLEMNNLEHVLSYLRESTGRNVIISDYKGTTYSLGSDQEQLPQSFFSIILNWDGGSPYLWDEELLTLCYKVGTSEKDGFIFVEPAHSEECHELIPSLEEASLAVKTYFNLAHSMEKLNNVYTNNFIADILLCNINIKELLKQNSFLLNYDLNNLYYVCIMLTDRILTEIEKQALLAYTRDWLKLNKLDIFCTVWDNKYLVHICPTHYDVKILDVDSGWKKSLDNITRYHEDVRKKFNFKATFGIGNKYLIDKLHLSYQEALYAIHLSELTGNGNQVRHIYDLGVYSLIFSNSLEQLKSLYKKYLNALILHDKVNNSMLLDTLRCYFDANLNINETAERLFLHINTLRYRLKRVEELTNTSFQKAYDRTNLYIALKVYDVLGRLELIDPSQ